MPTTSTAVPMLGPVIALVAWSLVMLGWLAAVRLPLIRGRSLPDGARRRPRARESGQVELAGA